MPSTVECPLPYPERFHAALAFVNKDENKKLLNEESKLLLYALERQSMTGPCTEPKPWGWNVVNNAKWQSWKQLGDMPKMEAMRLFVRTLEEDTPNWWNPELLEELEKISKNEAHNQKANGTSASQQVKTRSVAEVVVEGSWVSPYISDDQRPPPRYEHSTALVGNLLFLVGGNYAGRYLSDTWYLDLENLTWTFVCGRKKGVDNDDSGSLNDAFPACAGHAAVTWNGNVMLVGGHKRSDKKVGKVKDFDDLAVLSLDTVTKKWSKVETSVEEGLEIGPTQRGSHSGVIIGSKLYVFGGEDPNRKPLDELWTLDLTTWTWDKPTVSGDPPCPRSSHTAVTHRGRYMIIFGGGSVSNCYNDLVVLDTQTLSWLRPETDGPLPPIRAGHASAVLGSLMYLVGGGNNAKGCADMYSLDLSNLGSENPLKWTLIGNTPPESAIASEGLSLLCVPMAGCLVSFGGYNGKYHSAIHVYRPEDYVVVKAQAPSNAVESKTDEKSNKSASPPRQEDLAASELEASRREAAAAKESTALEVSIMRKQLDSANDALAKAEKLAEAAREALAEEEQKTMHLQVEIAELRKQLASMEDLEKELARYREKEATSESKKSGIWGYITGSDVSSK